jgi:hypothetical protein
LIGLVQATAVARAREEHIPPATETAVEPTVDKGTRDCRLRADNDGAGFCFAPRTVRRL